MYYFVSFVKKANTKVALKTLRKILRNNSRKTNYFFDIFLIIFFDIILNFITFVTET